MKYCPHCTTLYQRGAVFPECMRPLTNEIQENDPVCVISADGFERERIVAALRDSGIPCVERMSKKERSADAVTGKLAAKVKIQVPYGAYAQAKDILIGIGAIHTDAQIIPDENPQSGGYIYAHQPKGKQGDKKKAVQSGKKPAQSIEEFEEKVIRSDKPVLVDFWAEWCGPCRMLAPVLEQLAGQFEGKADIAKVDVDKLQELAMQYQVMNIPALFVIKDGAVVDKTVGVQSPAALSNMLNAAL